MGAALSVDIRLQLEDLGFHELSLLGEGANGVVYRAKKNDLWVAIKLLRHGTIGESTPAESFHREVASIACLTHPSIVEVFESGQIGDQLYLVTEFIDGTSLDRVVEGGALDEKTSLEILTAITQGLCEIHRAGFVHRDIKPSNVMVTKDQKVKLIDFGLVTREKEGFSGEQTIVGTLKYAAPEQLGLIKVGVDGRADLYSLGMMVYHCVSGAPAFADDDLNALMQHQLKTVPPSLQTLNPSISKTLSQIVDKLIAKNPNDRYESAPQLLYDLENIASIFRLGSRRAALKNQVLIGREEEVTLLTSKWSNAQSGKGSVCFIAGESGMGKTRICQEIMSLAEKKSAMILKGKNEEHSSLPLGALREAMHAHFISLASPKDPSEHHERALISECLESSPDLVFQLSSALRDIAKTETAQVHRESNEDQFAVAVADFLQRYFQKLGRPTVLLLDDAQWCSSVELKVVQKLAAVIPTIPVLVLITARSEASNTPQIAADIEGVDPKSFNRIEVKPLRPDRVVQMAQDKLGGRRPPMQIMNYIGDLAKGSPYMIDQILRSLIDSSVLTLVNREWSVNSQKLSSLPLQGNLMDVILGRLKNIGSETCHLLVCASMFGTNFRRSLLLKMVDQNERQLSVGVQSALKAGLIEHVDSDHYQFIHDKVLESLQETINEADLRVLHLKTALTLADSDDNNPFTIASHFMKSDFPEYNQLAFDSAHRAGREAISSNSSDLALTFLEYALEKAMLLGLEPALIGEIHLLLGKTSRRAASREKSNHHLHQALSLVTDPSAKVQVRIEIINNLVNLDMTLDNVEPVVRQAYVDLSDPLPESKFAVLFDTLYHLVLIFLHHFVFKKVRPKDSMDRMKLTATLNRLSGMYFSFSNQKLQFVNILSRAGLIASRMGTSAESSQTWSAFTVAFGILGKRKLSMKFASLSMRMAKELKDPVSMARAGNDKAMTHSFMGLPLAAAKLWAEFRGELEAWMFPEDYYRMINDITYNLLLRGRPKEMLPQLTEAIRRAQLNHVTLRKALLHILESSAQAMLGNATAAADSKIQAHNIVKDLKNFYSHPQVVQLYWACILHSHLEQDQLDECNAVIDGANWKIFPFAGTPFQKSIFLARAYVRIRQFEKDQSPINEDLYLTAIRDLKAAANLQPFQVHMYVIKGIHARIKGKWKDALQFLEKAQALVSICDANSCQFEIQLEKARIEKSLGNTTQARAYALHAFEIAQTFGWTLRKQKVGKEFEITEVKQAAMTSMMTNANRYSKALMDISLAMSGVTDIDEQARLALDEAIRLLNAERGFFFFVDSATNSPVLGLGRNNKGEVLKTDAGFSKTIINRVHESQEPIIMVADENNVYASIESIMVRGLKSIIAAPMFLRSKYVGIAYFDSDVVKGLFSTEDLDICRGLGSHYVVAQEMAKAARVESEKALFEKDLELTAVVQSMLVPATMDISEGHLRMSAVCKPSAICGGDWWWWSKTPSGMIRAMLVDVTGHGAAPAMVTAIIATSIRQRIEDADQVDFPVLMETANANMCRIIKGKYLATASAVELDPQSGKLRWWSAAAPFIVIVNKDKELTIHEVTGGMMGLEKDNFSLGFMEHDLSPGDRVYIFSDGLFELPAKPGIKFSIRIFNKMLVKYYDQDIAVAKTAIMEELNSIVDDPINADDMTLIMADFKRVS